MFKKLVDEFKALLRCPISNFDPATIGDPLAQQTGWTPLKRGGANFTTHKFIQVNPNRVEFRASWGVLIFCMLFFAAGVAMTTLYIIMKVDPSKMTGAGDITMLLIVGVVFTLVGGGMFYHFNKPVVFDRAAGYFFKGKKDPRQIMGPQDLKGFTELSDIHALQILSEYCSGNKSSYYSYELNLILNGGQRVNVIDHGNLKRVKEDAAKLAQFLGVPVWETV